MGESYSVEILHTHGCFFLESLMTHLFPMSSQSVSAYDIPSNMEELVAEKRRELIEVVSEVDDQLAESFLNDEPITANQLKVCSSLSS